jgi:hypothetical protein
MELDISAILIIPWASLSAHFAEDEPRRLEGREETRMRDRNSKGEIQMGRES